MARKPKEHNVAGSQNDIQLLANEYPELLDSQLSTLIHESIKLNWCSPLKDDEYAEYVDQDFIDKLGISDKIKIPLKQFWPNKGPNWDGLAKYKNKIFIIEAKAHISEQQIESTDSKDKSLSLIENSLQKTKNFLEVKSNVSWCKNNYYQYANRLAHLYFLRELNNIDAHLLFIYFLNDKTILEKKETIEDWEKAIDEVYKSLKIDRKNKLSNYIHHIYIDTNKFER